MKGRKKPKIKVNNNDNNKWQFFKVNGERTLSNGPENKKTQDDA